MTTPNEELIWKLRGQAYTTYRPDQLCDQAADLLQVQQELLSSQAERIKELESEVEMWKATANAVVDFEKVQLRAEIAAIAATEPVAWRWVWKSKPWDIEGWCYTNTPPNHPELQEIEKLFTHPMPAQRCSYCDGTGDVHSIDGEWRGKCPCAESKDAERYRWLRDYLISPSTHFDDLIVSADKAETLNGVIDAARAKGTK